MATVNWPVLRNDDPNMRTSMRVQKKTEIQVEIATYGNGNCWNAITPDGKSIIMNGSIAHLKGMPGLSVYAGSKAALLRSFARSWAVELADAGFA